MGNVTLSLPYLNNIEECEIFLNRWVEMWNRKSDIFILLGEKELLSEDGNEIYETFKNLAKQEYWEEGNRIKIIKRVKHKDIQV